MTVRSCLLVLATTTTGLVAGVFYGFVVAVSPGLGRLPDAAYLAAMQAINDVIQNPWFGLSFFGAPLLLPAVTMLYRRTDPRRFRLLAAASAIYLVGSFGVTVAANIPLNEALAAVVLPTAPPARVAAARRRFEQPWNRWHAVRTLASVLALGLAAAAGVVPPVPREPGRGAYPS